MTSASDMETGERKRQYSALRRAIYKDASPALVAKFSLATDVERLLDKPAESQHGIFFFQTLFKQMGPTCLIPGTRCALKVQDVEAMGR